MYIGICTQHTCMGGGRVMSSKDSTPVFVCRMSVYVLMYRCVCTKYTHVSGGNVTSSKDMSSKDISFQDQPHTREWWQRDEL